MSSLKPTGAAYRIIAKLGPYELCCGQLPQTLGVAIWQCITKPKRPFLSPFSSGKKVRNRSPIRQLCLMTVWVQS